MWKWNASVEKPNACHRDSDTETSRTWSDLCTEFTDGLFLLGPVVGSRAAPVDDVRLHPAVVLLQLAHLLQEAPQPGVQSPHGVSGVLQQVHGRLRKHIHTFSGRLTASPPSRPEGSENYPPHTHTHTLISPSPIENLAM